MVDADTVDIDESETLTHVHISPVASHRVPATAT